MFSSLGSRIKFISELEFEHGTKEIALETALVDFKIHQSINFRAGILLPQIGSFNGNHDSPKWEIIDRPLVSTTIIPSTLSEVGFGFFGTIKSKKSLFTYDLYIVNGLQDGVILNDEGRTSIPNGKSDEMFAEDNNGTPMFNSRVAFKNRSIGEVGISYYGGVYNTFSIEGDVIDDKRNLSIFAFDFSSSIKQLTIQGEIVHSSIQIPVDLKGIYGDKQLGGFIEFDYPFIQRKILGFDQSRITAAIRLEYVDYNVGKFDFNNQVIQDDLMALVVGLSYSPRWGTLIKANYRYHRQEDLFGNPPSILGGFQFGLATYF